MRPTRVTPKLSALLELYERPLQGKFYEAQHRNPQIKHSNRKAAKLGFQVIHVPGSYTDQTASGENSETEVHHLSQSIQVDLGKLLVP